MLNLLLSVAVGSADHKPCDAMGSRHNKKQLPGVYGPFHRQQAGMRDWPIRFIPPHIVWTVTYGANQMFCVFPVYLV